MPPTLDGANGINPTKTSMANWMAWLLVRVGLVRHILSSIRTESDRKRMVRGIIPLLVFFVIC